MLSKIKEHLVTPGFILALIFMGFMLQLDAKVATGFAAGWILSLFADKTANAWFRSAIAAIYKKD